MAARLGHAIYWTFVVMTVVAVWLMLTQGVPAMPGMPIAAMIYGFGYAIRYVLTGTKSFL